MQNGPRRVSCESWLKCAPSIVRDLHTLRGVAEGQSVVMQGHVLWFVWPCLHFSCMLALISTTFLDEKIIALASGTATPLTPTTISTGEPPS